MQRIRATFDWLAELSLSGVWRTLRGAKLGLRSALVQQYSPDPEYEAKVAYLLECLAQTAQAPEARVALFLDEMGYGRWPEPGPDWGPLAPAPAPRTQKAGTNSQWRLVGALNALSGQVDSLDNYLVGRTPLVQMYRRLDQAYPQAERIYVIQDNWSLHQHPEVQAVLVELRRIEPVWLPTYAPWLNPIEKLWRWLHQDVLKLHRLADDRTAVRRQVNAFLDQFAAGSHDLLHYVGLLGDGKLAQALRVT